MITNPLNSEIWKQFKYKKSLAYSMIAIIALSLFIYNQQQNQKRLEVLSFNAIQVLLSDTENNLDRLSSARFLIANKSDTYFSDMAKFFLSKHAYEQKDTVLSATILTDLTENGQNQAIRDLARIRLARLYYSEDDINVANLLLDQIESSSFQAIKNQTKAMGDSEFTINPDQQDFFNYINQNRG